MLDWSNGGSSLPLGQMPPLPVIASIATPMSAPVQGLATQTWLPLPTTVPFQASSPSAPVTSRRGHILSTTPRQPTVTQYNRYRAANALRWGTCWHTVALHTQLEDLHGQVPRNHPYAIPPPGQGDTITKFMDILLCGICGRAFQGSPDARPTSLLPPHNPGGLAARGERLAGVWSLLLSQSCNWHYATVEYAAARPPGIYLCWSEGGSGLFLHHLPGTWPLCPPVPPTGLPVAGCPALSAPSRIARPPRRPETLLGSWNCGACAFPGTCTYKHKCGVCQFGHRGIECPVAPEGPAEDDDPYVGCSTCHHGCFGAPPGGASLTTGRPSNILCSWSDCTPAGAVHYLYCVARILVFLCLVIITVLHVCLWSCFYTTQTEPWLLACLWARQSQQSLVLCFINRYVIDQLDSRKHTCKWFIGQLFLSPVYTMWKCFDWLPVCWPCVTITCIGVVVAIVVVVWWRWN